jgi:hypothetical protein
MKFKFSFVISLMVLTLFACQLQTRAQSPYPDFTALSLMGRIDFPTRRPASNLKKFDCSDFTVVVGKDERDDRGVKRFTPYASAQAQIIDEMCSYRVGSVPLGQKFEILLRLTDPKKFPDGTTLNYSILPPNRSKFLTLKKPLAETRYFKVNSLNRRVTR